MTVVLELKDRGYVAGMNAATLATERLAAANKAASLSMVTATKNSFAYNQALYTTKRLLFYGTLGVVGMGAALVKLGFDYNNALQTARVALQPLFRDAPEALTHVLDRLYKIAALSPFLYKDTTVAFRQMYVAFSQVGFSADETIDVIQALTNSLSVAGKVAPQNLNRAAVALQHMAFQGRLTGRTVQQLAMDGLPIYAALNKEFGISQDQLHNIAELGISAKDAMAGLLRYLNSQPVYRNAAQRIANQTLQGSWAQFKDFLSKGAGGATGGLFSGLHETLKGVNEELTPLFNANKPITLTNIAEAFDKQLSPSTHAILNTFLFLQGTLQGLAYWFGALFKAVTLILWPFDKLANLFGANHFAAKALGTILGVGIGILVTYKLALLATNEALLLAKIATMGYTVALRILTGTESARGLLRMALGWRKWAFAMTDVFDKSKGRYVRTIANTGLWASLSRAILRPVESLKALSRAITSGAGRIRGLSLALRALPALTAITLAITLLIERKAVDRAVTSFLRGHHLGFLTGGQIDAFKTPYESIPGFARSGILKGLQEQKRLHQLTAKQISILRRLGYPGLAEGGIISRGGNVMVGEQGPEILNLPASAQVIPLNTGTGVANFPGMNFPEVLNLKAILRVDGRDLAEAVARHRLDRQARR